jgi:hypothetical protein
MNQAGCSRWLGTPLRVSPFMSSSELFLYNRSQWNEQAPPEHARPRAHTHTHTHMHKHMLHAHAHSYTLKTHTGAEDDGSGGTALNPPPETWLEFRASPFLDMKCVYFEHLFISYETWPGKFRWHIHGV